MQINLLGLSFIVNEVALMQISFSTLPFFSVSVILAMLYSHHLNPYIILDKYALL